MISTLWTEYPATKKVKKKHNYYFGMRYDVTLKIGDYKGPLDYTFTGDDDLWVVLDGDKIVKSDLGGVFIRQLTRK